MPNVDPTPPVEQTPAGPPPPPSLIDTITQIAKALGIPPELALAVGYYESGLNPYQIGDNGTSFGLYQLHQGGELGAHDANWAYDVANNARTALGNIARIYHQDPSKDWGQIAAEAQRPQDPTSYASAVDNILSESGNSTDWFGQQVQAAAKPYDQQVQQHFQQTANGAGANGGADTQTGTQAQLTQDQLTGGLNADGFAIGLIDSVPQLKNIFSQALQNNWSVERTMVAIQNTPWFRDHSAAQRQFLELQASDPQQLQRKIQQTADDLRQSATALGVPVTNFMQLAQSVVFNGLDATEQTQALVRGFHYHGQSLTGQVGTDIDALKGLASNYAVEMDNHQLTDMAKRMMVGQLQPDAVTNFFKQHALGMFPYLKQQLDAGLTVADVASPYKTQMAKLWYDDPSQANNIATNDPTILKALQQTSSQGTQLMPVAQFQQMLKQDPRWLHTTNARDALMDSATGFLQDIGLISGGSHVGALGSSAA